MVTETHTTIQPIHNHTTELVYGFLVGHNYMEKLSETVFDTFEPDSEVRYMVAGEKVLYVPEHLKTINEQNIKLFVELTILEDRNKGDSKIVNKFRSWLYGMKLSFSLVH